MQTMNSGNFRAPALNLRFFLLLAAAAILTVLLLQVSGAPYWARYFAGLVGAPFIVHAVRTVESVTPPRRSPQRSRSQGVT